MPASSGPTLLSLPPEIVERVYHHLPKSALLSLRFLPHYFGAIATAEGFRTLCLKPYGNSPERFINIAKSPKLRQLVREIFCDTWVKELDLRVNEVVTIDYSVFTSPLGLMSALDYIRYFQHLDTLHIWFNEHFSWIDDPEVSLRYEVLAAAFECLAGTWYVASPVHFVDNERTRMFGRDVRGMPFNQEHKMPEVTAPINLSKLSIRNLGYMEGKSIKKVAALRTVLASGSITSLELHTTDVTTVLEDDEGILETVTTDSQAKYEFYEALESTWLFPESGENLTELSVTAEELWGWSPQRDIHNYANGRALPNLKVLTLGNYVFGFKCQVDWLASLGLERLSIVRCAVLFRTFNASAVHSNPVIIGRDNEGNDIVSTDCPTPEWWDISAPGLLPSPLALRWHLILQQWRRKMPTLREFSMGAGEAGDFRYVDNVGESFCYEFDDDDSPGSWNDHFVLEPDTRRLDREAWECIHSEMKSRVK